MSTNLMKQFINDESGQGITEYGAILAFVAVLIGMVFATQGTLSTAINKAYLDLATQLNAIST